MYNTMALNLVVDCVWNVIAHAQKPDFAFRRNGRAYLNRGGRGISSVDYWQASYTHQPAGFVLLVLACVLQSCDAYWLPTPFASFPFTSPPVRHCVPSHFKRSLLQSLCFRSLYHTLLLAALLNEQQLFPRTALLFPHHQHAIRAASDVSSSQKRHDCSKCHSTSRTAMIGHCQQRWLFRQSPFKVTNFQVARLTAAPLKPLVENQL
jgi:hypothetical protein